MSALEELRSAHEELEVYHRVLLHELSRHPRSKRQIVFQDHKLAHVAAQARKRARVLVDLHADKHGLLAAECAELQDKRRRFPRFYHELSAINGFHAGRAQRQQYELYENQGAAAEAGDDDGRGDPFSDLEVPTSGRELVDFSGEEFFGRFLDLHALFSRYRNLPGCDARLRYEDFVKRGFFDFACFPAATKTQRRYREYVAALLAYLEGFLARTRPLHDHASWTDARTKEFEIAWSKGEIARWEGRVPAVDGAGQDGAGDAAADSNAAAVDVSVCENARQLEKLGLDKLKAELMSRGCKCGGTLTDRAERLFLVRNMSKDEIPAKLRAKANKKRRRRGGRSAAAAGTVDAGTNVGSGGASNLKYVALCEWLVASRAELSLSPEIADTVRQLQRKHTRTHEEMQREMEQEVQRDDEEAEADAKGGGGGENSEEGEDDEGEMMYNPKGLPLGWDGKPIPYWLYRLHGLSKSFKCEICGNHTYWGHREFDSHFQEARHIHGMKCLKIPNTNHFHGITKISDALQLYAKLQEKLAKDAWNTVEDEEFEDSAGNILSKATYLDLQKQGLL